MSKSQADSNECSIADVFAVNPCKGETAILTGQTGVFGTVGNTYDNNAKCRWMIRVREGLVR